VDTEYYDDIIIGGDKAGCGIRVMKLDASVIPRAKTSAVLKAVRQQGQTPHDRQQSTVWRSPAAIVRSVF
jgi:hypothetical protein